MDSAPRTPPIDAAWAICRSVPGLLLTGHLLLLVLLSRISPNDAVAFGCLCLAWPILIPIALFFGLAALRHSLRMPKGESIRQRCLIVVGISLVGTLVCGTWFGVYIAGFPSHIAK